MTLPQIKNLHKEKIGFYLNKKNFKLEKYNFSKKKIYQKLNTFQTIPKSGNYFSTIIYKENELLNNIFFKIKDKENAAQIVGKMFLPKCSYLGKKACHKPKYWAPWFLGSTIYKPTQYDGRAMDYESN